MEGVMRRGGLLPGWNLRITSFLMWERNDCTMVSKTRIMPFEFGVRIKIEVLIGWIATIRVIDEDRTLVGGLNQDHLILGPEGSRHFGITSDIVWENLISATLDPLKWEMLMACGDPDQIFALYGNPEVQFPIVEGKVVGRIAVAPLLDKGCH